MAKKKTKKYKFCGMILSDGDTFEVQEEAENVNPYNPTGVAVYTFHHKNWNGIEEISG